VGLQHEAHRHCEHHQGSGAEQGVHGAFQGASGHIVHNVLPGLRFATLQPSLFTEDSQVAYASQMFSRFKFKKCRIVTSSSVPTAVTGEYIAAVLPEPNPRVPHGALAGPSFKRETLINYCLSVAGAKMTSIWNQQGVPVNVGQKWFYTDILQNPDEPTNTIPATLLLGFTSLPGGLSSPAPVDFYMEGYCVFQGSRSPVSNATLERNYFPSGMRIPAQVQYQPTTPRVQNMMWCSDSTNTQSGFGQEIVADPPQPMAKAIGLSQQFTPRHYIQLSDEVGPFPGCYTVANPTPRDVYVRFIAAPNTQPGTQELTFCYDGLGSPIMMPGAGGLYYYPLGTAPEAEILEDVYFTDVGPTLPTSAAMQEMCNQAKADRKLHMAIAMMSNLQAHGKPGIEAAPQQVSPSATANGVSEVVLDVASPRNTEFQDGVVDELKIKIRELESRLRDLGPIDGDESDDDYEQDFRSGCESLTHSQPGLAEDVSVGLATEEGPCPVNMLIPRQYDTLATSQTKIASALVSDAGLTAISQLVEIESSTSNVSTTLSSCFDPLPLPNLRVFVVDPIPGPKATTVDGPVPIVAIDQAQANALIDAINDIAIDIPDYTTVLSAINTAVTNTSNTVGTTSGPAIVQIQQTIRNATATTSTSPQPPLQDSAVTLNAAICSVASTPPPTVQDALAGLQTTSNQLNASVCSVATTPPATVQDQLAIIATSLAAMPTYAQIKALVNDFSYQTLYALIGGSRVVSPSGFLGNSSSTAAGSLATAITGDNSSTNFSIAAAGPLGPQVTANANLNAGNVATSITNNADGNTLDITNALSTLPTISTNVTGIAVNAGLTATNTANTATAANQTVNALTTVDVYGATITLGDSMNTDSLGNHFVLTHNI